MSPMDSSESCGPLGGMASCWAEIRHGEERAGQSSRQHDAHTERHGRHDQRKETVLFPLHDRFIPTLLKHRRRLLLDLLVGSDGLSSFPSMIKTAGCGFYCGPT